jgi:hypothetical protein
MSILFYSLGIGTYQLIGRNGPGGFSNFTFVTNHVFGTRSMSWLLLFFVPIIAMTFDVVFKVFSNLYFPTQTQIHLEHEAKGKIEKRKRARAEKRDTFRRRKAERSEDFSRNEVERSVESPMGQADDSLSEVEA